MNGMLAVGTDSDYAEAGGGSHGATFIVAFALVGLILLLSALRLIRKRGDPRHKHRYTLPRH